MISFVLTFAFLAILIGSALGCVMYLCDEFNNTEIGERRKFGAIFWSGVGCAIVWACVVAYICWRF